MKIKKILFTSLFGASILFASSCSKEAELTDCEKTTYESGAKAILDKSCNTSGCHDGTNERKPLTNFTEASNLSAGIMKRALTDKDMPPSGTLSTSDMETLKCWIDNGKKEK